MVRKIFACLLLTLALGCDGDDGPCNPQVENIPECPVEGILQNCNDFRCNGDQPLGDFRVLARDCEVIDCFTIDCGIIDVNFMTGIFSVGEVIEPGIFTGVATVEGQEGLEYECSLTMP